MRQAVRLVNFSFCFALISICLSACGGSGPTDQTPIDAGRLTPQPVELPRAELLAQIESTPAPDGVAQAIWDQLTDELQRVLAARDIDKVISAPPTGDRNRVGDLHIEQGGSGEFLLVWTYTCAGDYDQNSEVNVADLTPIGVHFGAVPGDIDWGSAQIADGDRNGQVGVSDITPVGQNFMARTLHYNVYASDDEADYPAESDAANGVGARLLGEVSFDTAAEDIGGRAVFSMAVETPDEGDYYWVRPSDGETDGSPSNLTSVNGRGDWWMTGREPMLNGRSQFFGPRSNDVAWSYATGEALEGAAVVTADGRLYFGSDDDSLHAVSAAGDPLWTYPTGGDIASTPAIGADGLVYFGNWDGHFYSLNPDGSLNWDFAPGAEDFFSPAVGPDGVIYVGNNDHNLYALNPDMSVAWTFPTGDAIHGCPALGPDGAVYVGSYDGSVYAINGDGTERWTFLTGDQVRGGVALAADGTVYAGSMDSFLYAIGPDGNERWRYDAGGPVVCGPAIGVDGAIYFGSVGGRLIALNSDGSLRWRYRAYGQLLTRPAIGADGLVYFGNEYGLVFAVSQDGNRHWYYETGGQIGLGLALGNDGTLYAGSADGNLYAFGGGPDGTPATIAELGPLEGMTGAELTLGLAVEGTPPFNYSWELGGGAAPDPATGASPVVTLGEPGIYQGSVTVDNAYGDPATQEFDLYVQPAPAGGEDWIHSWGGGDYEGLADLAVDSQGHIHCVGYTESFGSGGPDILLVEYSADGELLAAQVWGGPGWENGNSIYIDAEDNVYVAGICTPEDNDDTLLMRFNADGELSWTRSWHHSSADSAAAVAVAEDGTIYVAGRTSGSSPEEAYGALLLTYSASGELLSTLTWDSEFSERVTDLALDSAGNLLAAGEVWDWGTEMEDAFVLHFDSDMVLIWARRFASDSDERYCDLALDGDDNVYISCASPQLLKYDTTGDLLWARTWTASLDMMASCLAVSGERLVAVGGYYDLANENFNAFMMSGGTDGSVDWARMFMTAYDDDIIWGVVLPTAEAAYMCGEGWTNLGTWQDVAAAAAPAEGLSVEIVGLLGVPEGMEVDSGGVLMNAVGMEDTPAGEANTTAFRLGLE